MVVCFCDIIVQCYGLLGHYLSIHAVTEKVSTNDCSTFKATLFEQLTQDDLPLSIPGPTKHQRYPIFGNGHRLYISDRL